MVTPFLPAAGWVSEYMNLISLGVSETEARSAATGKCGIAGKSFARCQIATGPLTVPVEGGASRLKRKDANPLVSEHGKWRREHLGAINAAYGRTPYFIHLMPEIEEAYSDTEGLTLEQFNSRLLDTVLIWINVEEFRGCRGEEFSRIRREASAKVDARLSILDPLFRLGKETVFAL